MRRTSYEEIAEQLGIRLCPECGAEGMWGSRANRPFTHEKGWTDLYQGWVPQGVIHWRPRRVTRSGVRRFLMLAADLWIRSQPPGHGRHGPEWYDLWRRIEWARRTARYAVRIEIPPQLWAEDRARLAAKLASAPPIHESQPSTALLRAERERALRWARRRRA